MNSEYYKLKGKDAVPCTWEECRLKLIFRTVIDSEHQVRTRFIGENQSLNDGPPEIFDTWVYGGALDRNVRRYSTWAEAERGHNRMCESVQADIDVRKFSENG